jgi:translation initiation factor IF-3
MDYGKFKYEEAQKAKEARRNQANTILKEVRFRLKIDTHDYETKRKRAEGFLQGGDKVKAMILFRGREQSRPEQGVRLLQKFAEDVSEFGSVESTPTIDGRNMVMVIGPHKNKATAKAEADARKAANKPTRTAVDAPAAAPAKVAAAPKAAAAPKVGAAPAPVEAVPAAAPVTAAPAKAAPAPATTVDVPAAAPAKTATPAKPATPRPATPAKASPATAAKPKTVPTKEG